MLTVVDPMTFENHSYEYSREEILDYARSFTAEHIQQLTNLRNALANNDFKKGVSGLRNLQNDTYCCLGVACHLVDPGQWREESTSYQGKWYAYGTDTDEDGSGFIAINPPAINPTYVPSEDLNLLPRRLGITDRSLMAINDHATEWQPVIEILDACITRIKEIQAL